MGFFKIIEHTADIGIEVHGDSMNDLFVHAAEGMVSLLVVGPVSRGKIGRKIEIAADSKEQLLVRWLEELLFLFEGKKLIPVGFVIGNINDRSLSATVSFLPFSEEVHRSEYQIKAVTYHNLSIVEKGGRFSAMIIFDI